MSLGAEDDSRKNADYEGVPADCGSLKRLESTEMLGWYGLQGRATTSDGREALWHERA